MYCDLWWQYIQVRKLFKGGNYSRKYGINLKNNDDIVIPGISIKTYVDKFGRVLVTRWKIYQLPGSDSHSLPLLQNFLIVLRYSLDSLFVVHTILFNN